MTNRSTETDNNTQETKTWTLDQSCAANIDAALILAQVIVEHEDGLGTACTFDTDPDEPVEGVGVGVLIATEDGDGRFCPAESAQGGVLSVIRAAEEGRAGWFALLEDDRPLYHILESGADVGALPRDVERLIVVGSCDLSRLAGMDLLRTLAIFGDMKLEGLSTVFTLPGFAELKLDNCLRASTEGLTIRCERDILVSVSEQVPWRGSIRDLLKDDDD